jgi:hypothetical protein
VDIGLEIVSADRIFIHFQRNKKIVNVSAELLSAQENSPNLKSLFQYNTCFIFLPDGYFKISFIKLPHQKRREVRPKVRDDAKAQKQYNINFMVIKQKMEAKR